MVTLSSSKLPLLQIITNVCNTTPGLIAPSMVVGNTDPQIIYLLGLANKIGREISQAAMKRGGWQELRKEYQFTTNGVTGFTGTTTSGSAVITGMSSTTGIVAGYVAVGSGIPVGTAVLSVDSSSQVTLNAKASLTATGVSLTFGQDNYALPDDYTSMMAQTYWDRAFRWQLLGPLEAQEWQVLKSGISPTGPRRRFRVMDNRFYLDPVPSATGNVVVFEYYSNGWCQSSGGTVQTAFAADTDLFVLDDMCLEYGIRAKFLSGKGFDAAEAYEDYQNAMERAMSRNGGSRSLPLNAQASGVRLLNSNNVPDTGFGS